MRKTANEARSARHSRRILFIAALAVFWGLEVAALAFLFTSVLDGGFHASDRSWELAFYRAIWTGIAVLGTFMMKREW